MAKVYVIGQSARIEYAEETMAAVRALGHEITFDWAEEVRRVKTASPHNPDQRLASAMKDLEGLRRADGVVFLHPTKNTMSTGCWWELGYWTALWQERCRGEIGAMRRELDRRTLWVPACTDTEWYGNLANPGPCIFDAFMPVPYRLDRLDCNNTDANSSGEYAYERFLNRLTPAGLVQGFRTLEVPSTTHLDLADALGVSAADYTWLDLIALVEQLQNVLVAARAVSLPQARSRDAEEANHDACYACGMPWTALGRGCLVCAPQRIPAPLRGAQKERAVQVDPAPPAPPEVAPVLGGPNVAVESPQPGPAEGRPQEDLAARVAELERVVDQLRTRVRGLELAVSDR